MKQTLLAIWVFACLTVLAQVENLTHATATSAAVRLDLREDFGGRVVSGTIPLSREEGVVTLYGRDLGTLWDTTALLDGWVRLSTGGATCLVAVLNDSGVALEEGRLTANVTWDDTKVHLVRNDVYVPKGITLTITEGTVVKFTEDSRIIVEVGGKMAVNGTDANPVQFALATDDTVGGDTDMHEGRMDSPEDPVVYCYNTSDFSDNSYFEMYGVRLASLPDLVLHDARAFEGMGSVRIPVTVSGSRNYSFWIEWRAVDGTAKYGTDYTAKSGRVTWSKVADGTKYIEIPLVQDNVSEEPEYFTVQVTCCGGVNVPSGDADVMIDDIGEGALAGEGDYGFISAVSEEAYWVDARTTMALRPMRNVEEITYSQCWTKKSGAVKAGVMLYPVDMPDQEELLAVSNAQAPEGKVRWDTAELPTGRYLLAHDILDGNGKVLESLEALFFLNREAEVHDGMLDEDETWTSEKVHIVSGDVIVPDGVQLDIEDGAVVKFLGGTSLAARNGGGIFANAVIFTHIADDAVGGDINLDGTATSPVSDAYQLTGFTPGTDCELRYLTLTFEGGAISGTRILQGYRVHKVTGNITVVSGGKLVVQPGAIVKMSQDLSITVNSGGTLEALGTRAQPIVFTSIKDDAHGGDTNQDGSNTWPEEGDWIGIIVSGGQATFEDTFLQWGGWGLYSNQGDALVRCNSGSVTLNRCVLQGALLRLIYARGNVKVANSVLREARYGIDGRAEVINCVLTGCSDYTLSGSGNVVNSILYNTASSSGYASRYCNFWKANMSSSGAGNRVADPLFTDADNGDFTLKAGSPCIDAGDGSVAPELDYFGQPRQDLREVADTGTAAANGCVPDIGIHEVLPKNAVSAVDLVAVNVECAQSAVLVGDALSVNWTLRNDGGEAAAGTWRDYLYLVDASGQETLLGSLSTTASIAPNGLRVLKGTFIVPDVNEGEYLLRVKTNQNRDIFEGALTANNIATSESMVEIAYPKATVKDGVRGSLAAGESTVQLVEVEEGYSLALIHAPKGTKVYYSLGTIPTEELHISSVTCLAGETMLSLPTGEVYLLVVAPDDEACDYSIDFTEDAIQVSRLEPSGVYSGGISHVLVHGSMFSSKATVQLLRNGEIIEVSGEVLDDNDILLTLNTNDLAQGFYDVKVIDYDGEATLENGLQVLRTGRQDLSFQLKMPESARVGRWFTVTIEYTNCGDIELPAPIFHLSSTGRNFEVGGTVFADEAWLYGISGEYPYGWLKPGEEGRAVFRMQLTPNAERSVGISCAVNGKGDTADYLDLRGFFDEEWLREKSSTDIDMMCRLHTAIGNTKGHYRINLANFYDATGYGYAEAVDFKTVQSEFFFQALNAATIEPEEETESRTELRSASGFSRPSKACSLTGRLPVYDSSLRKSDDEGVRKTDSYFNLGQVEIGDLEDYNQIDWEKFGFADKYNDGSRPGDVWWFHKECNWWHRATLADVKAKFTSNANVYVICHGNACSLQEDYDDWWVSPMAQRILAKNSNATVLAVDWGDVANEKGDLSGANPQWATPHIPAVADELTRQLTVVFGNGFGGKGFTLIGHSHGAHLAGNVARRMKNEGCKPVRLVGMDTSPMNTHEGFSDALKFPQAWNGDDAGSVEFFKTSFGFSMGTQDDGEVYGCPTFYVVENGDDFKRDLYKKGVLPHKGYFDALGSSLHRHSFSHDWFSFTILSGGDFGWNWKESLWRKQPIGNNNEPLVRAFCGVLSEKVGYTSMELGSECVANLNAAITSEKNGVLYRGTVDGTNWRFYSRVLGKQADADLGLTGYSALERLWNLDSLLVEYYAKSLEINQDVIRAEEELNLSFFVGNFADNFTMNVPRTLPSFWNPTDDWRDRSPSQLPWDYKVGGEHRSVCHTVRAYNLSQLTETEKTQLINEVTNRTISAEALMRKVVGNADVSSFILCEWTGERAYIPAGEHDKLLDSKDSVYVAKFTLPEEIKQQRNSVPVGYYLDAQGEQVEYPDGEPFLLVGRVAQVYVNNQYVEYPGDLYADDNYVAKIVYVRPSQGECEAIATKVGGGSKTHGGSAELRAEMPRRETQADYPTEFEVETDDEGNWSITLTGEKSWTTNAGGLQFYNWILPEGAESSSEIHKSQTNIATPSATFSGTLPKEYESHPYDITLSIFDFMSLGDNTTVTVIVSRPQVCLCKEGGKCTCVDCRCGGGSTGPQTPQSCDPNEMAGMYGFGDSATQRFVQPGEEMTYTIYFENKADATAAAQEVKVTSALSKWLDWNTFQVAEVGFHNQIDKGLAGKSSGTSEVVLEGTDWKVRTEVELNSKRGIVTYYLRIVDETTADGWPESAYDGFLPPNDAEHSGEGYIRYKVKVREDVPEGARIDAVATIVFDYNDPITTSPAWFNWVGDEDSLAATGYMTWDEVDGATYEVTVWTGDPDINAEGAEVVAQSGVLSTNRWRLPAGLSDSVTYFWSVATTDSAGDVTEGLVYSFELGGRATYALEPGWNLVSLPFAPDAYSERMALQRTLFAEEDKAFVRPMELELGRAYWLYSDETDEPWLDLFPSGELRSGEEELVLSDGWNMVGPLAEDAVVESSARVWRFQDGGWHPLEAADGEYHLHAGEGYMIWMDSLEAQ